MAIISSLIFFEKFCGNARRFIVHIDHASLLSVIARPLAGRIERLRLQLIGCSHIDLDYISRCKNILADILSKCLLIWQDLERYEKNKEEEKKKIRCNSQILEEERNTVDAELELQSNIMNN